MKKSLGIICLFVAICLITAIYGDGFLTGFNLTNLTQRTALFSILALGAGVVIVAGGIDLSIGSVVCLAGIMTPWLLVEHGWSAWAVIPLVLAMSATIGLFHGVLITRLRLQPFLVTLCGLLLYRGIARWMTGDQSQGFQGEFEDVRSIALARFDVPFLGDYRLPATVIPLVILVVLIGLFFSRTVWGRWLLATGRNENAARYSGVPTAWLTTGAYVVCSLLAGFGGMLFIFDIGSAQPSDFGNFYELYAIAAAVLGGCSLRGGDANVLGIVVGAATLQVLRTAIILVGLGSQLEFAVIGGVLLIGIAADELVRRYSARRAEQTSRMQH
ncbi:MAG: ABC transporter permease [Planctomycetota bacterium]|nr:MAG: ABC transporter permease [Planctomycetota bacterium]RLS94934.1 MAG: ABC transporter permease [Planctomycetota bacterium]